MMGGVWLAAQLPAIEHAARHARLAAAEGRPFQILTEEEAAELGAIAEQIYPADETPGARDAGVVHFMDRAFETFRAGQLDATREGLEELRSTVRERHPDVQRFSELAFEQQTEILREIESTPFFISVLELTRFGLFAAPSWGGNRDETVWRQVGFESRPTWQPPFGEYDAEALDSGGDR